MPTAEKVSQNNRTIVFTIIIAILLVVIAALIIYIFKYRSVDNTQTNTNTTTISATNVPAVTATPSPSSTSASSTKTLTNSKMGFKVTYPSDWVATGVGDPNPETNMNSVNFASPNIGNRIAQLEVSYYTDLSSDSSWTHEQSSLGNCTKFTTTQGLTGCMYSFNQPYADVKDGINRKEFYIKSADGKKGYSILIDEFINTGAATIPFSDWKLNDYTNAVLKSFTIN